MSQRREFVEFAAAESANLAELCRRFQISRKTGYKWLNRYRRQGAEALADRSRRPHRSPLQTPPEVERMVLAVRQEHPVWGGRKIRQVLLRRGEEAVPSASTITEVLRRHGELDEAKAGSPRAFVRFEADAPNDLWQMDFKGHIAMRRGRCHPLTVLDDHSRYAVGLIACLNERRTTVQSHLTSLFRQYGLPRRMLMDNGAPWGSDQWHRHTPLTAWLIRLGIGLSHGRPYHPQTQGKDERFHRTLKAEVLQGRTFTGRAACQEAFDEWRPIYNFQRPHEALELQVPADRYEPSPRAFPHRLPPIEYGPDDAVRRVQTGGWINFRGRRYRVPKAFRGHPVGLRPTTRDGVHEVYFCRRKLGTLDERQSGMNASGRFAPSGVHPRPKSR